MVVQQGASGKGIFVGNRTQVDVDEAYTDIVFSATDNRIKCPYCNGTWFQIKGGDCVDSGELPASMDGYNSAGTEDMIIFLCHCGREFGIDLALGEEWTAQVHSS